MSDNFYYFYIYKICNVYLYGHLCQKDHSEDVIGHTQEYSLLNEENVIKFYAIGWPENVTMFFSLEVEFQNGETYYIRGLDIL